MMNKVLRALLVALLSATAAMAQQTSPTQYVPTVRGDQVVVPKKQFIAFGTLEGAVLHTNDYIRLDDGPQSYTAATIKYGFSSAGECWEDIAYGMPYGGIGIYAAKYSWHEGSVGTPFSLFIFQGGTITQLSRKLALNYEWGLGMSAGWVPYDPIDNPTNIAIGSTTNVHVSLDVYLKWYLNPHFDLNIGGNVSHFSNGASKLPNAGFNLAATNISLIYNFNRKKEVYDFDACYMPPPFQKRMDHDISLTVSSRAREFSTEGTNLPSKYVDHKFKVIGLNYAMLFANSYRYKWGPGVDFVYDESAGATAWRQLNPADGKEYDRVQLGDTYQRMALGLSVKGELVMPRYSIFANVGYDVIPDGSDDARLYQILGLKIYLKENLFGTFGIRANHFSAAQYLYWSLGYTIAGKTRK